MLPKLEKIVKRTLQEDKISGKRQFSQLYRRSLKYEEQLTADIYSENNLELLDEISELNGRLRRYLINKIINFLNIKPQRVLEVGSAGDYSLALTLPESFVIGLDIDPDVFCNDDVFDNESLIAPPTYTAIIRHICKRDREEYIFHYS